MIEALLLVAAMGAMAILLITVKRVSKSPKGSDLGVLAQKGYERKEDPLNTKEVKHRA